MEDSFTFPAQFMLNTHMPFLFVWNEEREWGVGGSVTTRESAIFYCLQIHITFSAAEEPRLKRTEQSPDPDKRASANPGPAGQASGRLWLPAPQ